MYLITSINAEEQGYELVIINSSKAECEKEYEAMQKKVWFNEDGTQKAFSDIYDDTRAKNAKVLTNKQTESLFGGRSKLERAVEYSFEY